MKSILLEKIDERLHMAIKIQAIKEKKTMRDFILDTLHEKIFNNKNIKL